MSSFQSLIGSSKHTTIDGLLDAFNHAAAVGDLTGYATYRFKTDGQPNGYFGCFFDARSRFLGTDKNENWTALEFFEYANAHFNGSPAWIYRPISGKRIFDIYPNPEAPLFATFDELLESESFGSTSRGSGTLHFQGGHWFITAYHLTFPLPNEIAKPITSTIERFEKGEAVTAADDMAAQLIKELGMEEASAGSSKKGGKTSKKK